MDWRKVLVRCGAPYCVLRDKRGECRGEIFAIDHGERIGIRKYRRTDGKWAPVSGLCCISNGDSRMGSGLIPYKDFTGKIIGEL